MSENQPPSTSRTVHKEFEEMRGESRELRGIMSDLISNFARLEGKIDTQTALLERVSVRQDKGETKVDIMEREFREDMRRLEDKNNIALSKVEDKTDRAVAQIEVKTSALQKTVYMAVGGLIIASFLINLGIQLWKMGGA